MSAYIVNASPQMVSLGTLDASTRAPVPATIEIPQHLPKTYFFGQKGLTTPTLTGGADLVTKYGKKTFDPTSAFFNHASLFGSLINAKGNTLMTHRLLPDDIAPPAGFRLSLQLVANAAIDPYDRNVNGTVVLDGNGDYILDGGAGVAGYDIAITRKPLPNNIAGDGQIINGAGFIEYPILDVLAPNEGSYANNSGIRLYKPTFNTAVSGIMEATKAFPIIFEAISRATSTSSAVINKTKFGEDSILSNFIAGTTNPSSGVSLDIASVFPGSYENTIDPKYPLVYSDYGDVHVYGSFLSTALASLIASETAVGLTDDELVSFDWSNATIPADEFGLTNFFDGTSSLGVPYYSIRYNGAAATVVAGESVIVPSSTTNIYMEGGDDGTMSVAKFEAAVTIEMDKYIDADSMLMDIAINPESIIYDSGYTLATKKELCSFIGLRPDTFVVLGTYDPTDLSTASGTLPMSMADEASNAITLKTRLELYPESSSFGTPVTRGIVVGQSALIRNSLYTKRVPMTAEIAIKSAKYMGAGSAEWNSVYSFDSAPGSIISEVYDVQPAFIPANTKISLWDTGLIWAQPYDLKSFFFPALQTVYSDDTSVLNNYFTACAIAYLNKVADKAWRRFTGTTSLTAGQLIDRVNNFVRDEVANKFDGKFVIVPDTIITAEDEQRGFSWTLIIKIYASGSKTVMTTKIEAYRKSDLV